MAMNTQTFFLLVFVLQYPHCNNFLFKKLRNRIKEFFKGKPKISEFLVPEGPEYPANNPQKLAILHDMWNTYYNCLRTHFQDLGQHKSVLPEAVMAFEGTSIRFDCKVCVSPADTTTTEDVIWNYIPIPPNGTKIKPVELGEHIFVSPEDKALHMYNLNTEQSGQYFCQNGKTITAPYFLEIVGSTEPIAMVMPKTAPEANHSRPMEIIPEESLKAFTEWGTWSPCSQCNLVGKRVRFGMCTVQHLDNASHVQNATDSTNTMTKQNYMESNITSLSSENAYNVTPSMNGEKIKTKDKRFLGRRKDNKKTAMESNEILILFKKGIPCRSFLLPKKTRLLPQISERKSEIMVGFCKVECPDAIVFEVTDEKGEVVETANNSAGIYSTLQGIPTVPPSTERRTMYEDTKSRKTVLRCPGNLNTDIPAQWQIGHLNINPTMIYKESNGRIFINMKDQLVIQKPRLTDSNIYSCWQGNKMAGTIRLIVTEKLHFSFNHHIMLLTTVLILGSFLLVCFRAFRGRKVVAEL